MGTVVDSIEIQIASVSSNAEARVNALARSLEGLRTSARGGAGLGTWAKQLAGLRDAAREISTDKLRELSASLTVLGNVQKPSGLSSAVRALSNLKNIDLSGLSTTKMRELADSLNILGSVEKSAGLTSTVNALKKLPEITASLGSMDMGAFATQIQRVASAMAPLATEMQQVANGFAAFPSRIQRFIQSSNALAASNITTSNSFGAISTGITGAIAKISILGFGLRQLWSAGKSLVEESTGYVENLNLFTVTMGNAAEEALKYAETVKGAVGIDPSEWIRNQGLFKQITSGFGVVEDKANLMSKNLTQLGYDISSYFNIDTEDAMLKLQSGIAGEVEPLRRLGYAIDVATLQQVAYNHGITQSVNSMDQAQKSQLRYLAIMEQSGNVMGDMARTVISPANAMRILKQELAQLARAAGNLLIPALTKIIPVVQAVLEILTEAVQALANLFGFELPKIDYSGLGVDGVTNGVEDLDDAISSATGSAKELKRQLIGIDELTILDVPEAGGGGAGGGASGLGGDFGLDLPEYDFLAGVDESVNNIKSKIKDLIDNYAKPLGAAFSAIGVPYLLKTLGDSMSQLSKLKKLLAGAVTVALEFAINKWSIEKFLESSDVLSGLKYLILDVFSTSAASYLLYRTFGAKGLVLGIGVGIVANATGLAFGIANGAKFDDIKTLISAALTVAIGAVGGAVGLSKLGFFWQEGLFIGASFALSLSLTAINFGAIASGQLDSGSLASILMTVGSSLAAGLGGYVLASAAFGASAGPVGLAIGLGVGLVINIAAASIAEKQNIRRIVFDAFMESNNGQTTLTDIELEFERLSESVSSSFQSMADSGANLETIRTNISDTITSVNTFVGEVKIGAGDISEDIEKIKSSFNQLKEDSAAIFEEERQIIIQGLAGSIGEVAEAVGVDLPAVSSLIGSLATTSTETAQGFMNELSTLSEAYATGAISAEEYYGKYYDIMSDFQNVMGDSSVIDQYAQSVETWKSSMNFSDIVDGTSVDINALHDIFTGFETSYTESIGTINSGTESFQTSLDDLKRAAEESGYELSQTELRDLATLMLGSETDRATAIATMQGYYGEILDSIQNNLISGLETQANALETEYESKSPWYKALHPKASYVQAGLQTYEDDVVSPILNEIQSSMERIGLEGEPWASGAIQDVLSGLVSYDYDSLGGVVGSSLNNVGTLIQNALSGVKTTTVPVAEQAGKDIAAGLLSGNEDYISENKGLFESVISRLPEWTKDLLGINSPSTVFAEIGRYASEGLLGGISEKWPNVTGFFTKNMPKVVDSVSSWWENVKTNTSTKWGEIASTVGNGILNLKTTVSTDSAGIANPIVSGFNSALSELSSFSWGSIGTGIATGIVNGMYNIGDTLRNWGTSLLNSVKNLFSIHSPSRVFRDEVGYFLGAGIGVGLEDSRTSILSTISGLSDDMQAVFAQTSAAMTADAAFQFGPDMSVDYSSNNDTYAEFDTEDLAGVMRENNEELISVLFGICSQLITAIDEKDSNMYFDGEKVTQKITSLQEQYDRMYRR